MRNIQCRLISLFLGFLLFSNAMAVTKRAVVIGLGQYEDSAWEKINGDRDVPLIVNMLHNLGYRDIVTLVNKEATKSCIVASFRNLEARCRKGDIVYVHFSGHGQRMTDVNGDESDDGWDEAWIPYDAYLQYGPHDRGEKHLSDDEIGRWMGKIRKAVGEKGQIVLIVDACHSGDSSRDSKEPPVRGVLQNFIIPGEYVQTIPKIPEKWLTLSACKSFQRNGEVLTDNGHYGMLSYALFSQYTLFKGKSNADILQLVTNFVNEHRGVLPQSPVLTGEKNKYQVVRAFYD